MKILYQVCGKISLLCYLFLLYQLWHLCQFGGSRRHLLLMLPALLVFAVTLFLWLAARKHAGTEASSGKQRLFRLELIAVLLFTVYFAGRIIYSAIPYHGALSWKIDEWMRKKEVQLEHTNLFESGAEGVLKDLDEALDLPEELYISNQFQITFDGAGTIQTIYAFLYGADDNGTTRTYLVDYNAAGGEEMDVWVDGEANAEFQEDMRLEPMLRILQAAPWEEMVNSWTSVRGEETYEILYMGRRSFQTEEGLVYLPGDADGDGEETGITGFAQLSSGGEVVGYEVSLHIPEAQEVTPVRYIMEPEYISQEVLKEEQEQQQTEAAIGAESWTVDNTDGTMYFFLDDNAGWRLVVADAAAGSRFYQLEQTENGGDSWNLIHEDPFGGELGVTEGLLFFDENVGFAGLTGASQSSSRLYRTKDGGVTFDEVQLPMEAVAELPETAEEYGLTAADYDYLNMPEKEGDTLTIRVVSEEGETEGLVFQSRDSGETWTWEGTFS